MDTLPAALLLTAVSATGAKDPDSAVAVNDRRELLVDEFLVEKSSGKAQLQNHQPVPRGIMLRTGVPWKRSEKRSQP